MKQLVQSLNENEIKFMYNWGEIQKHKSRVTSHEVNDNYILAFGQGLTNYCSACLRDSARTLQNHYNKLLPKYNAYLESLKIKESGILYMNEEIDFVIEEVDEDYEDVKRLREKSLPVEKIEDVIDEPVKKPIKKTIKKSLKK